jgi:sugar-specific transcriptional regulator TrmB
MKHNLVWKNFDRFGLNTYEAKSYLSLLERNSLTAPELSRIAGIPRARIYETLENLIAKGLCNSEKGKVKKYSATNPSVLRDILMVQEKGKFQRQIDQ